MILRRVDSPESSPQYADHIKTDSKYAMISERHCPDASNPGMGDVEYGKIYDFYLPPTRVIAQLLFADTLCFLYLAMACVFIDI